jgi:hypothetical protein
MTPGSGHAPCRLGGHRAHVPSHRSRPVLLRPRPLPVAESASCTLDEAQERAILHRATLADSSNDPWEWSCALPPRRPSRPRAIAPAGHRPALARRIDHVDRFQGLKARPGASGGRRRSDHRPSRWRRRVRRSGASSARLNPRSQSIGSIAAGPLPRRRATRSPDPISRQVRMPRTQRRPVSRSPVRCACPARYGVIRHLPAGSVGGRTGDPRSADRLRVRGGRRSRGGTPANVRTMRAWRLAARSGRLACAPCAPGGWRLDPGG